MPGEGATTGTRRQAAFKRERARRTPTPCAPALDEPPRRMHHTRFRAEPGASPSASRQPGRSLRRTRLGRRVIGDSAPRQRRPSPLGGPAAVSRCGGITGLPPGRYMLVHTVNPDRSLAELTYQNNTSRALIRVARDARGPPPSCSSDVGACALGQPARVPPTASLSASSSRRIPSAISSRRSIASGSAHRPNEIRPAAETIATRSACLCATSASE